jgi:hypothetical protein
VIRSFLVIIAAAFVAFSAAAQEAVTPPRFFIERIEVRNATRVSPDVVISESRLHPGQEYNELELSDAAARLNRLPFLLSADFSLEKGSERGRHILVITLAETKPFFYLLDVRPIFAAQRDDTQVTIDSGDPLGGGTENQGVLGARWFIGRRGAVHLGLFSRNDNHEFTEDYSAFMVGYTQYDLFGTQAFATLNLKQPISAGGNGAISPEVVVGVPLSPNQTLTLTYDETRFSHDTTEFDTIEFARQNAGRVLSARWSYNTTDDPFLPTNGTLLSGATLVASRDASSFTFAGSLPVDPVAASYHTNSYGIDLRGAHYFALSDRNTIAVGGEAGWARVSERSNRFADRTSDATYQFAHVAFSHSLWDRERQKHGDSRFEWQVRVANREHGALRSSGPEGSRIETAWAWVRRSAYGTIRLGVGYAW